MPVRVRPPAYLRFPHVGPLVNTHKRGRDLLVFDGSCVLCNRIVKIVVQHDRRDLFRLGTLDQLKSGHLSESMKDVANTGDSLVVFQDFESQASQVLTESAAVMYVASQLGMPWRLIVIVGIVPRSFRDRVYRLVARSRYRLFGKTDRCWVLPESERWRFSNL